MDLINRALSKMDLINQALRQLNEELLAKNNYISKLEKGNRDMIDKNYELACKVTELEQQQKCSHSVPWKKVFVPKDRAGQIWDTEEDIYLFNWFEKFIKDLAKIHRRSPRAIICRIKSKELIDRICRFSRLE